MGNSSFKFFLSFSISVMYLHYPSAYAELPPEVSFTNALSSLAINDSDNETPTERLFHCLIDLSERFS